MIYNGCQCRECMDLPLGSGHTSDCAVHNEPDHPKQKCDCGALKIKETIYVTDDFRLLKKGEAKIT